jgi:hypothetical protein
MAARTRAWLVMNVHPVWDWGTPTMRSILGDAVAGT